jgi:hypothetical protein
MDYIRLAGQAILYYGTCAKPRVAKGLRGRYSISHHVCGTRGHVHARRQTLNLKDVSVQHFVQSIPLALQCVEVYQVTGHIGRNPNVPFRVDAWFLLAERHHFSHHQLINNRRINNCHFRYV